VTKILIFDLGDVWVEGFSRVAALLAQRLNRVVTDIMPALGRTVGLPHGRTAGWSHVLAAGAWPCALADDGGGAGSSGAKDLQKACAGGMPELLTSLRAHRQMLLSDQGREWMACLDATHPFLGLFERRFLTCEMGQTKRQITTFQRVIAEFCYTPHDCVFIDDLPWNVARAHMVGLRATQFTSVDVLKGFLAQEHLYILTAKLC
jgi:hypothetical protein